jgi:hypothetical protein
MTHIMSQNKLMIAVMGFIVAAGLLLPGLVLSPNQVLAQSQICQGQDCAQQGLTDIGQSFPVGAKRDGDIKLVAKKIIEWALYFAAIIAVIFLIIGGFLYITSAGNETQSTKGRKTLVNALIGLAIIVLSYLIVQVVYNFLTK